MAEERGRSTGHRRRIWPVAGAVCIAALAAGTAVAVRQRKRDREGRPPDSAPGRTARSGRFGDYAVTGRTVTINKSREELFAFWSDFRNLPRFMENVEAVQLEDGRAKWTVAAPLDRTVTLETEIVERRENELIAWRSTESSAIDARGRVTFRDAPGGRGTRVEAIIAYRPPAGDVGRIVAKLFRREPAVQGRHELKRLKMLMETGEIASSLIRPDAA